MNVGEFIESLKQSPDYAGQIVHQEILPKKETQYASLSTPFPETVERMLKRNRITKLYTHQVEAIEKIRKGNNTLIVTSTASGKTLCYTLPMLECVLNEPEVRVLYFFPTKALAQDQLRQLHEFTEGFLPSYIRAETYDGDTPTHKRKKIRSSSRIILTNPDMLHASILAHHIKWAHFLSNVRLIVLDEIHVYRGIFGSHVALVIRRLNRLLDYYGSNVQYICCSATIANPEELAKRLTGKDMALVNNDGAPKGKKHFLFWNPPREKNSEYMRVSANSQAQKLLVKLIKKGVQSIVFTQARILAELIYRSTKENLEREGNSLADKLKPYRGGYLPEERRNIEQALFSGKLLGVVSTNALELGIDIGGLDACLLVGFPGSIASTWQRAGRAGRTHEDSLVVYIASNNPIDQFFMHHPQYFFEQSFERAVIDPENPYILSMHLSCAAYELPLSEEDETYFSSFMRNLLPILEETGYLKQIQGKFYCSQAGIPALRGSLRTSSEDNYSIINMDGGSEVIGTVDAASAFFMVHPGAVYLHEGEGFLVRSLDIDRNIAYVRNDDVPYFTQPLASSTISILETQSEKSGKGYTAKFGIVEVTLTVFGFTKVRYYTLERIGSEKLDLPSQTMETSGLWIDISLIDENYLNSLGIMPLQGLVGIKNIALVTLPMLVMCDRNDIGGVVDVRSSENSLLFLYDKYPGGVGFVEKGYELLENIFQLSYQMITSCSCKSGCPSCVGAPEGGNNIFRDTDANGNWIIPDKTAAIKILELFM